MIKKTKWRPDTCECEIVFEWDTENPEEQKAVDSKVCEAHRGINKDHRLAFDTVLFENRLKNKTLRKIADESPDIVENLEKDPKKPAMNKFKEGLEPKWHFDENRKLVIDASAAIPDKEKRKQIKFLFNPLEVEVL